MRVRPWEAVVTRALESSIVGSQSPGTERDVEKPAVEEGSCCQRKDSGKDRMHLYEMFGSGWTLHRSVRNAKMVDGRRRVYDEKLTKAQDCCSVMRDLGKR